MPLIAILGPTASGKSSLAEALSESLGGQLLNADAFQVYRGLDIGTAKPKERSRYELLDCVEPSESFSVGRWLTAMSPLLQRIYAEERAGIVVGGTGLYVRALFEGYSDLAPPPEPTIRATLRKRDLYSLAEELRVRAPEVAASIDIKNPARVRRALERLGSDRSPPLDIPPFVKIKLALVPSLDQLARDIEHRVAAMFAVGWVGEVKALLARGVKREDPGMAALGYREIIDRLEGKISEGEAKRAIVLRTRQYAKRQLTWLRKEPSLIRLQTGTLEEVLEIVRENLSR